MSEGTGLWVSGGGGRVVVGFGAGFSGEWRGGVRQRVLEAGVWRLVFGCLID